MTERVVHHSAKFDCLWFPYIWMLVVSLPFVASFLAGLFWATSACAKQSDASPGYVISPVIPFVESVPPKDVRAVKAERSAVLIEASPGEFEPGSFVLAAMRSFKNLTLTPTALKGEKGVIAEENVDVRVVKVWDQAGRGPQITKPVKVGELLVKDDALPFKDSFDEQDHYVPPKVPQPFAVRTDIESGKSKQFWITVKVPRDTPPGNYRGSIRLESSNSEMHGTVELQLTVLPIQLREPRQDRLIYYRGSLDPGRGRDFVDENQFAKQLADIRAHGFTGITVSDTQEQYVRRAVELIAAAKFPGPIIFMDSDAKFPEIARSYGLPALFYGRDEPLSQEKMQDHLKKSSKIQSHGGKVVTAINRVWAARLADPKDLNAPLDVVNLRCDPDFFSWVYAGGPEKDRNKFPKVWYYWQIMVEKPGLHRLLSGFFLWRSHVDGIFPYVYQHHMPPASPFDDFATRERRDKSFRAIMVTYPSADGPIPTLQWEALREGIDDLYYITTLERLIEEAKTAKLPQARDAVTQGARLLDQLAQKIQIIGKNAQFTEATMNPIPGVGPVEYAMWRKDIIKRILDLQVKTQ